MTSEEHDLITGLFNRLHTADTSNQTPKDQEAVQLIGQLTGQQPAAPYLLVQTLLVQEHALANAQARIHQLEQQAAQSQPQAAQKPAASGGFLSGLFGHSSSPAPAAQPIQGQMPPPMPQPAYSQAAPPPYPTTTNMAPGAGGGFLKGALGTAAGVAGGALLFQGVENLLGHNAGPFGGGFGGGGGFLGGGGFGGGRGEEVVENNEVVNNYYGDDKGQGGIPAGAADSPAVPGHEDTRYDDANANAGGNFDTSNTFDKPDNFGLGNDNSSVDNNYDAANPDANGGGLFGGGDTSLGDNSDFSGGSDDNLV